MTALKKFIDQLAQNAAKQPGWVPLVIFCYLALPFVGLPSRLQLFGRSFELSDELWTGVLTLVLFLIGDALDKGIYKPLEGWLAPGALGRQRDAVRSALQIHDGIYDVAKALATAAGSFQRFSVQFLNETAKFLRSLVVPALVVGFGLVARGRVTVGALLVVTAVLLIPVYVRIKAAHIRHLYDLVLLLRKSTRCHFEDFGAVRMFFWDGGFVGSAILSVAPVNRRLHPTSATSTTTS